MLTAWYADVLARHKQLLAWTSGDITPPHSIWLPGLFNPKACLTAVMQAHARQCRLPLDVMRFLVRLLLLLLALSSVRCSFWDDGSAFLISNDFMPVCTCANLHGAPPAAAALTWRCGQGGWLLLCVQT
jgi:hypothetical protein